MPVDPTPQGELLTTAEVAKLLKISVSSVRRFQSARALPLLKVGGRSASSRAISLQELGLDENIES
jgi:excisionase family DNA binding protein